MSNPMNTLELCAAGILATRGTLDRAKREYDAALRHTIEYVLAEPELMRVYLNNHPTVVERILAEMQRK